MPLFNIKDKKVLFIHIPKTGGTTIESILSKQGKMMFYEPIVPDFMKISPQHLTYHDFEILGVADEVDFCFTIVRNPYERIESEYFFRNQDKISNFDYYPDFSNWLVKQFEFYRKNSNHFDNHLRPQHHFIGKDVKVFKYDRGLTEILNQVCNEVGIECSDDYPWKNKSNKMFSINWSNQAIEEFNKMYSMDFEIFGYDKKKINNV